MWDDAETIPRGASGFAFGDRLRKLETVDDDVVEQVALADELLRLAKHLSITSCTHLYMPSANLLIELRATCWEYLLYNAL